MRNNRRRIELMNALLLSLPGTPVIYYGDEIGMGDNIYLGDRNGVRTPMQWSSDRNAGFSDANPQSLYLPVVIDSEYHYEAVNVETQANNPHSLLSWMKRILALRKRHHSFGRGSLMFLNPENDHILGFVRQFGDEIILVIANLSRFVQPVELDLSGFQGLQPVELFGKIPFPVISNSPYTLTLGPHAFYWFLLETAGKPEGLSVEPSFEATPSLSLPVDRISTLDYSGRAALESAVLSYLQKRTFQSETRSIRFVEVSDTIEIPSSPEAHFLLLLVEVHFYQGDSCLYQVPIARVGGELAASIRQQHPESVIALNTDEVDGLFVDATAHPAFGAALLNLIGQGQTLASPAGELDAQATPWLQHEAQEGHQDVSGTLLNVKQSNTSLCLENRYILKIFRTIEGGINPDLEISRFLSAGPASFPHVPRFGGSIEYHRGRAHGMALAMLQNFVPNLGTAWDEALEVIGPFFEAAADREVDIPSQSLPELAFLDPPPTVPSQIGPYLEHARLIGERTAELHLALARDFDNPDFAPEPFSSLYQRSVYQSMRGRCRRVIRHLHHRFNSLAVPLRPQAQELSDRVDEVLLRFRSLLEFKIPAQKLRIHGDYHLGQILRTKNDYVIIDFEGDASRPFSERRLKRSPLRDVASLLNSYHYAASISLTHSKDVDHLNPPESGSLRDSSCQFWTRWVSAICLRQYVDIASQGTFLPRTNEDLARLLIAYQLEKGLETLAYELDHRPNRIWIPIQAILQILDE